MGVAASVVNSALGGTLKMPCLPLILSILDPSSDFRR
jgi:hypothetical protein